jgi:hypothetical protein
MINDMDEQYGMLMILFVILIVGMFIYANNKRFNNELEGFDAEYNNERKSKSKRNSKRNKRKRNKRKNIPVDRCIDIDIGDLLTSDKPKLNTEFIEQQYHKDYTDTITGINNLTPQKELFNMGYLPVHTTTPGQHNVNSLVDMFVKRLNNEIGHRVSEYLHMNSGWSDQGKIKRPKSGFEEQMEFLGLPSSIYTENADKAPVNLVSVTETRKDTTDDQVRITISMVLQKVNVKDQIVLRVEFFMEKEDMKSGGDHRANFFDKTLIDNIGVDHDAFGVVTIERIFIEGFLTDSALPQTVMDNFHNYDDIMTKDGIIDQYKVIQTMKKKHKERAKELNSFLDSTDNFTKEIYDTPGIGDYDKYENTRTIMDDLEMNPQDSFGNIHI